MDLKKRIRVLLAKHPHDSHAAGFYVVATGLRDAGFEVILTTQLADGIVETAIQEDVDVIGYRIMAGEPSILISLLFQKIREKNLQNIPVIVGGIIPEGEIPLLKELGVSGVFLPGSRINSIADFIKELLVNPKKS